MSCKSQSQGLRFWQPVSAAERQSGAGIPDPDVGLCALGRYHGVTGPHPRHRHRMPSAPVLTVFIAPVHLVHASPAGRSAWLKTAAAAW